MPGAAGTTGFPHWRDLSLAVYVVVDADGENEQLRLRRVVRAIVNDGGLRGQGGEQVAALIGDDLDLIIARIEGKVLFHLMVRPQPIRRVHDT